MARNWIALPEVTERTEGEIRLGYTGMPSGFDLEQLEVNTSALQRGVIDYGGFTSLTLACYRGDEDQYNIDAGSANADGTAYGTAAVTASKAESSSMTPVSDGWLNGANIRNGDLGIQWNISALNSRITLDQQFDPRVRAKQLNDVIKRDAIKGVVDHNIVDVWKNNPSLSNAFYAVVDGHFVYLVGSSSISQDYPELALHVGMRTGLMFGARILFAGLKKVPFKDLISDPVFFSNRSTRAATAAGVLATQRLVRAAPKTQPK